MWPRAALMTIGLLVLCAAPAAAAPGSIEGSVKDTSGVAIVGATVTLRSPAHRFETSSDARGAFTFGEIEEGVYGLQARAAGFAPISNRQVAVAAGAVTRVEVSLARAAANGVAMLGAVTVNGSSALSRASAPTTDINPQALASQGGAQLSDVLGQQLAVTMVRQAGGATGSAADRGAARSGSVRDHRRHRRSPGEQREHRRLRPRTARPVGVRRRADRVRRRTIVAGGRRFRRRRDQLPHHRTHRPRPWSRPRVLRQLRLGGRDHRRDRHRSALRLCAAVPPLYDARRGLRLSHHDRHARSGRAGADGSCRLQHRWHRDARKSPLLA